MKKLLAFLTLSLLLCSVLVPQVFALQTGPSISTGLAGITHAGFLMEGEIGNLQVKYDTNLPLGEIKDNIKPAPNPAGKKTVAAIVEEVAEEVAEAPVVEEEVETVVEEEAADVEGVIGVVGSVEPDFAVIVNGEVALTFNSAILLEMFVAEDAFIVTDAEWTLVETDSTVSLAFAGTIIAVNTNGVVNATYNGAQEAMDVNLTAGTYYMICTFAESVEGLLFDSIIIDAFAIVNNFYASLQLEESFGTLPITLTVVLGGEIENIVIEIAEIVAEEPVEEVEAE